jgi:succinate dehydrogenase / fumarate reductase cytochrome b subunit
MAPRRTSLFSTVTTKILIALTGLSLIGFLCMHLAGNLLLYFGPAKFNAYSHVLISNPFVIPAEIGLLAIFVVHVLEAATMWWTNRDARPVAYQTKRWAGGTSRKSLGSTTMIWTGSVTFVFVAIHVATFKYGPWYLTDIHGATGRDLYRLVLESFRRPLVVAFYVPCMALVGFHLWHGFASAFESLGVNHPKLTPKVIKVGKALALFIGAGFLSIPLVLFFLGGRS